MQIFHRSTNTFSRATIYGAVFIVVGIGWALMQIQRSPYVTYAGVVKPQPVPFSHKHHVTGLGIDCRYCHTSVEVSSFAGIPPTKTCMAERMDEVTVADKQAPVIEPGYTFGTVTDKISTIVLNRPTSTGWFVGFGVAFMLTMMMLFAIGYLVVKGTGIWGINIPIGWGFAIVNFVWWIGIGHAGTLISAILLLLRQSWRNSINRFAEAMTLFAVAAAGIFPLIHTGRPWLAYWLFPYPNTMNYWPQFRSPLLWDVFAVSTYFTISLLFWFVGLIPDLATLRDRSENRWAQMIYGTLAMGWRGSARHWHRYETMYLLLAGLATPLVLSVHTVVSFDFAIAIVPGWHTTIFPPYFVAGAIYSGFAMSPPANVRPPGLKNVGMFWRCRIVMKSSSR